MRWKLVVCTFILSLWVAPSILLAQDATISGRVFDAEDSTPLPGVNVILEGTTTGTATDMDGAFSLDVPAGDHTLVTSFIGYQEATRSVSVAAGEAIEVEFRLQGKALGLDEVVVTGTGGQVERKALGNTIAPIEFAGVEDLSTNSVTDALAGKEPGVSINAQSGALFQEPKIRIRGTSSLSMTNQPIVYVNGVRVNSTGGFAPGVGTGGLGAPSGLANINFDAIQRVEILKGPAAATLYGSQANAGVIQIFTKQGTREQAPQFDFQYTTTGYQMPGRFKENAGFVETGAEQQNVRNVLGMDVELYEPFTSPVQLIDLYGMGLGNEFSGSVRGGGGGMTYFANLRYNRTDGPFDPQASTFNGGEVGGANDLYQRFYFTGNLNIIPSDVFRFNLQTSYTNTHSDVYGSGIDIYTPTSTARYAKPERVGQASEFETFGLPFFATPREGTYYEISDLTNQGRVALQANYLPSESLSIDASFGIDYTDKRSGDYTPFGYDKDGIGPTPQGALAIGTLTSLVWSVESKANWRWALTEGLESSFVVGFQGYRDKTNTSTGSGNNFPAPGLEVIDATAIKNANSSFQEVVNAGLFAQEQLDINEYLYLTAGLRLDASSAFGSNFSFATYPKLAVSFLPLDAFGGQLPGVSTLRLRGAWGQSGQQPGAFDRFTTFTPVNSPEGAGVVSGNLGNEDLRPEVATEWEAGFEVGLAEDRVGVSATYWDRVTHDALVDRSYVPSGGFETPQLTNVGTLVARGIELSVDASLVQRERFSLSAFANTAYLYEQVESLGGAPPIKVDAGYVRDRMFIREGYAPASYFGTRLPSDLAFPFDLEQDGQPSDDAALADFFAQPRDPSEFTPFVMVMGASGAALRGGQYYTDHYLGKPTPDWEGAFGFTARFLQDFTLSTRFQYAAGNYYHHNLTDAFRRTNAGIGRNTLEAAQLEAVLKNPSSSPEQRARAARSWVNEMVSLTPFDGLNEIEKADYLRWQNLSVSYSIPSPLTTRFGLKNASITASGNNLGLWTRYGGVDPLATGEGSVGANSLTENFGGGMDTYGTPLLRSYSLVLRIGL